MNEIESKEVKEEESKGGGWLTLILAVLIIAGATLIALHVNGVDPISEGTAIYENLTTDGEKEVPE